MAVASRTIWFKLMFGLVWPQKRETAPAECYLREYAQKQLLNTNQLAQAGQMIDAFRASHPRQSVPLP